MKQKLLITIAILILNATFLSFNCIAQFTTLFNFTVNNGMRPYYNSLVYDGTYLYGMTTAGGTISSCQCGVLFKVKPDGTGYVDMHNFGGTYDGANPYGSLILDGAFLYGMTTYGGQYGYGTIFKIKPDGTGYFKLFDFWYNPYGTKNGAYPYGSLISDGTYLYGMTKTGGANNLGVVFKIKLDGTGYSHLVSFSGAVNGANPYGNLIFVGTYLYGMTSSGGLNNKGTIFKIKTDSTGYTNLRHFPGGATYGANPYGSLTYDGTFLYGMTSGSANIFKILPDGSGYVDLHDFNGINGGIPYGSLVSNGAFLYGTTYNGGLNQGGVLFKIMPDGTGYVNLHNFVEPSGGKSTYGSLITDGDFLYGMTYNSGTMAVGTVFKYHDSTICYAKYTTTYDSLQNNFDLNVNSVTSNLAIAYHWDFGDGTNSSLATPSHTYTVDTTYNVCMKIFTADGDSCSFCHIIGKDYLGDIYRNTGFTINVHNTNLATGISQNFLLEGEFEVSPNPSNGIFKISGSNYKILSVGVFNIIGEKIYRSETINLKTEIDLSNQPNGIYFINIKTDAGIILQKIIINK